LEGAGEVEKGVGGEDREVVEKREELRILAVENTIEYTVPVVIGIRRL
jgi:hypothetical protein